MVRDVDWERAGAWKGGCARMHISTERRLCDGFSRVVCWVGTVVLGALGLGQGGFGFGSSGFVLG